MSMNFAREQSLLRQRLQAAGNAAAAEQLQQDLGSGGTYLGAPTPAIAAAANDLVAAYPAMGRAQMTAFVRNLWQSRIHELRAVGIEVLAARAALLEPADLPFLETLLKDCGPALVDRLAGDVLGALVRKNRKLWKDLRRLATTSADLLRRAALQASRLPLLDDAESFPRFAELATPLLTTADQALQQALDDLLAAAAAVHYDAVVEFVSRHGRTVRLPSRPTPPPGTEPVPPAAPANAPAAVANLPRRAAAATKTARATKVLRPAKAVKAPRKPTAKASAKPVARSKPAAKATKTAKPPVRKRR